MIRKIIKIDEEKCNGCGRCASACHEGAIGMVNGKAKLLREDYCDGLGDCLPACPTNAISFEEREAPAYNEAAVLAAKGSCVSQIEAQESQLSNFPIQIKLIPPSAPYFENADLLIAADCTAYAYADFHRAFLRGRIAMIACPKLDAVDYSEKLTQIFSNHTPRSVTVVRMSVPCCGGLPFAVQKAIGQSGKSIPLQIITLKPNGELLA